MKRVTVTTTTTTPEVVLEAIHNHNKVKTIRAVAVIEITTASETMAWIITDQAVAATTVTTMEAEAEDTTCTVAV